MVNITLNIPIAMLERLTAAVERVATAAERIAGPVIEPTPPRPFAPTDWMESSNALSRAVEIEDQLEDQGYGPTYQKELEARAFSHLRGDRTASRPDPE